jgi:antitoxin ChpS
MPKSTGKAPSPAKGKVARSRRFVAKRKAQGGQVIAVGFATAGRMPGAGFLAKAKLKKAGGSLVMTVPAAARNLLNLTEGQEMAVSVEGSKVIAEPILSSKPMRVRRPKYTLDELVAGVDRDAPLSDEERAWQDAPPVGREVW